MRKKRKIEEEGGGRIKGAGKEEKNEGGDGKKRTRTNQVGEDQGRRRIRTGGGGPKLEISRI
jgi:hypothetical protein